MMDVKRYKPNDPELQGRDVVLASEFDRVKATLSQADTLCGQLMATGSVSEATAMALQQELTALRARSTIFDNDASLSTRMTAAGMLTVAEIMAGVPLDAFTRHAGVRDLDTFAQWLEMRREEYLKLHARFALEQREEDELFDWITSHAAVFGEVMVNFKAAMQSPLPDPQSPESDSGNPGVGTA